jgi:hypothetical protein
MYQVLKIDPAGTLPHFNSRPEHQLDDREPIRELVA